MFDSILVPTNGSEASQRAIRAAVAFARSQGARIVGIAVSDPHQYAPPTGAGSLVDFEAFRAQIKARALFDVQRVAVAAAIGGVSCVTHVAESSRPEDVILATARECQCDLIFLAVDQGKKLKRLLGGGQTVRLLEESAIPILIFR